jgi:hypothetical protein
MTPGATCPVVDGSRSRLLLRSEPRRLMLGSDLTKRHGPEQGWVPCDQDRMDGRRNRSSSLI